MARDLPVLPSDVERLVVLTADELAGATVIWNRDVDTAQLRAELAEVAVHG